MSALGIGFDGTNISVNGKEVGGIDKATISDVKVIVKDGTARFYLEHTNGSRTVVTIADGNASIEDQKLSVIQELRKKAPNNQESKEALKLVEQAEKLGYSIAYVNDGKSKDGGALEVRKPNGELAFELSDSFTLKINPSLAKDPTTINNPKNLKEKLFVEVALGAAVEQLQRDGLWSPLGDGFKVKPARDGSLGIYNVGEGRGSGTGDELLGTIRPTAAEMKDPQSLSKVIYSFLKKNSER